MSPLYRRFTILLIALALALGLMTLAAGATPPADPPSPPADGLAASAGDEPPAIRLLAGTFRPAGGDPRQWRPSQA
jgi:hypothetical protein